MERAHFTFTAPVWEHDGPSAWHFVSLPPEIADDIEERFGGRAGGFGSVRVEAVIGGTRWRTSVFPDRSRRTYLLPIKRAVRRAEDLEDGSVAAIELAVIA